MLIENHSWIKFYIDDGYVEFNNGDGVLSRVDFDYGNLKWIYKKRAI